MSAALYIDNWEDIAKRRGFRPEVVARIHQARLRSQANAVHLAETERTRAISTLHKRFAPAWVIKIVLDTAKEHEISPADVVGECRMAVAVKARNHALYRIKEAKLTLSSPQIAKWFGRDHTTILHGLACHAKANDLPSLSGYNLEASRERNRLALRVGRRK